MNTINKSDLSKIELDILRHLFIQKDRMTCHHIIVHDENLRNKYSENDIISSSNNLESLGLITFSGSNGCIANPQSLKIIKMYFPILNIFSNFILLFKLKPFFL